MRDKRTNIAPVERSDSNCIQELTRSYKALTAPLIKKIHLEEILFLVALTVMLAGYFRERKTSVFNVSVNHS